MPLSMMSIGFSSWTITSVHNVNGTFGVETVLDMDNGTYITSCEVEYFEYMSTGFFTYPTDTQNCTPQIGDVGYITATLTINLEKCRTVFTANKYLQLQVELFNSKTVTENSTTLSLLNYCTGATCNSIEQRDLWEQTASHVRTAFTFTPSATAQSVTLVVSFAIDATKTVGTETQSIFKDEVYPILQAMKKNNVSLVVQASITEAPETEVTQ